MRRMKKTFSEIQITNWINKISLALAYLGNRKIIHRVLTPENIFIYGELVKIGNFGLLKNFESKSFIETYSVRVFYTAPELFNGQPYDDRSDSWSLGCILHELCTLQKAFLGEDTP
jgi:serine/threonine protein kinase